MDEPLASFDLPRKRELLPYLEKLSQDVKIPILYVSHSLDEILRLADKVIVMAQGKVKALALWKMFGQACFAPLVTARNVKQCGKCKVHSQHPDYEMTAVIVGSQNCGSHVEAQQGVDVRIRIDAADVSLVLETASEQYS